MSHGVGEWQGSPDRRQLKTRCTVCGAEARYDVDDRGRTVVVCEGADDCGHIELVKRRAA